MILLKLENINGNSQIKGHDKWIVLSSVQWGVGRGISTHGGSDRETSTPSFSEVTLSKPADIASTLLFGEATYGKKIGNKAELHIVQTDGKDAGQVYTSYDLYEPIISGYSVSSGGDRPSESFSINFSKIVFKYFEYKTGGDQVPADPKGWDIATGTPYTG